MLGGSLHEAFDVAAAGKMLANGAQHDHAHALVRIERLEYKPQLVALRHFNERHYDLVLTDLSMPVMDGYTLATCLRNQGARTPIVAITADVTAADSQRLRDAGISGVLLKPMSLASIDAAARRYLSLAADPRAEAAIEADAAGADAALSEMLLGTLEQRTAQSPLLIISGGAAPKLASSLHLPHELVDTLIFEGLLYAQGALSHA